MPGFFSSGSSKVKYPGQKDVAELRYPEAVGLESELRDYFRGLMQSPNMGYTPRQTYDPMSLYMNSIQNRGPLVQALTRTGAAPSGGAGMEAPGMPSGQPQGIPQGMLQALSNRTRPSQPNTPFGDMQFNPINRLPSWQETIDRSVATRPQFPTTPEELARVMGPSGEKGMYEEGWGKILPFYLLTRRLTQPQAPTSSPAPQPQPSPSPAPNPWPIDTYRGA